MKTIIIRSQGDIPLVVDALRQCAYPVRVEIKQHKAKRSLAQNRLYWKWLGEIRDHVMECTGKQYATDDLHDLFRDMFLPKKVTEFRDRVLSRPKSTTELTVAEFSEYLDKIDHYAADKLHLVLEHGEDWAEAHGRHTETED